MRKPRSHLLGISWNLITEVIDKTPKSFSVAPLASLEFLPRFSHRIHLRDHSDTENLSICKFSDFFFFLSSELSLKHSTWHHLVLMAWVQTCIPLQNPYQGVQHHKSVSLKAPWSPTLAAHRPSDVFQKGYPQSFLENLIWWRQRNIINDNTL